MPYHVVKQGSKFVVEKQDGSRRFGTHDTREEANAQMAALYAAEKRMAESRTLHLLGALGQPKIEMVGSKECLVVPVVALMEGVIHAVNAETPEFVPFETLQQAAETWNGKPVTIGHPKGKDGKQCSALDPGVVDAVGIGTIRNARAVPETKKLLMEALIETAKAKRLNPDMYQRLAEGGTEEVSVGASVITDKAPGVWNKVKKYLGKWTGAWGDHLAFLPGGRGACSVEMGCGTHRAAMRVCEGSFELLGQQNIRYAEGNVQSIIDPETLRCLRDIPQSERDKLPSADFAGPDQSFPIMTQADVDAAEHLIGKAADPEAVKRKIIAIAKRKGLTLPKAWQAKRAAQAGDAEEQAELIAYQAMKTAYDTIAPQLEQLSGLIDDLIADEKENPTETDEEEADEEQVETARIESVRALCTSIMGALQSIAGVTYGNALSDAPRYMAALAGARHSAADARLIQAMHDHSMELGAQCDRGNMKTAEDKNAVDDNPTRRYIATVRKAG